MGRNNHLVATPEQVKHEQHHHCYGLGMQAHFRLLNDHPIDLRALLHLSRRKNMVQTEEKRSELALPCGPCHERKLDRFTEFQAEAVPEPCFLEFDSSTMKNGLID